MEETIEEIIEYPFESIHDFELIQFKNVRSYYYCQLSIFSAQNMELITRKNKEYGLTKEGPINYTVYNYMSCKYDLDFYHPEARKFIKNKYFEDLNDPLIFHKINFQWEELNSLMKYEEKRSKNNYNKIKWSYWCYKFKMLFCQCFRRTHDKNEYTHLINW